MCSLCCSNTFEGGGYKIYRLHFSSSPLSAEVRRWAELLFKQLCGSPSHTIFWRGRDEYVQGRLFFSFKHSNLEHTEPCSWLSLIWLSITSWNCAIEPQMKIWKYCEMFYFFPGSWGMICLWLCVYAQRWTSDWLQCMNAWSENNKAWIRDQFTWQETLKTFLCSLHMEQWFPTIFNMLHCCWESLITFLVKYISK